MRLLIALALLFLATTAHAVGTITLTGPPASDTTPDAFTFTDETDIAVSTAKTSNAITVTGIDAAATISVTGDTGYGYSKNAAGCTSTAGTVVVNDTVSACVTSSDSNSTATTATVTIGGIQDTYSVTTAAGGGATTVSDDFSGDLSAWTVESGNWSIVTGELQSDTSAGVLSHDTDIGSVNQWAIVQFGDINYSGLYFRFTGNTTDYAYAIRPQPTSLVWRECTGSSCATIATWTKSFSDGAYIGAEISGAGTSTVVSVWDFGATPPADRASWGAADWTSTADPDNAADTGTQIGLYSGGAATHTFDNFEGGSL